MLKEPDQVQFDFSDICDLDQLKNLQSAARIHIKWSGMYLRMLRDLSIRYDSDKNHLPWKTLKEGSYYLHNAYHLVKTYKDCVPGSINNKNIQSINDMLVELEFDPNHISSGYTDEAYGGKAKCFVSKGQGTKYYKLLHSDSKTDVRLFIQMVELNIDAPLKRFLESIKQRLQFTLSKKLLEAIKDDNPLAVEDCIKMEVIVNFKDIDGRTPLHYAVNNGNIDIVSTLLRNGSKVIEITNKGNTPLHIATSKGYREIIEVLLQYVNHDESNDFVNAKTISGGTTSLHVAAKNGFLEVLKSLLRHGASYDIENKEGKTPINLSKNQKVSNFLKLIEELFKDIKNGDIASINKLRAVEPAEFEAITNARNNQRNTLLQVAVINKHKNIANNLLKMLKEPDQVQFDFSDICDLDQLKNLQSAARIHIKWSGMYLRMLRDLSIRYDSDKNHLPWKTLKEGSYYLHNAYRLVKTYKDCVPGSINNKNIQSINDMLVELEFDPKHISSGYTDEAYGGKAECFVSKGQGTKYYKLLHSDSKTDVRLFLQMVELNIDAPVKWFLESINQSLKSNNDQM